MHGEIQELGLFCFQTFVSNSVSFVVSTLSRWQLPNRLVKNLHYPICWAIYYYWQLRSAPLNCIWGGIVLLTVFKTQLNIFLMSVPQSRVCFRMLIKMFFPPHFLIRWFMLISVYCILSEEFQKMNLGWNLDWIYSAQNVNHLWTLTNSGKSVRFLWNTGLVKIMLTFKLFHPFYRPRRPLGRVEV
jgi:hypothetical protein